jgi:hypothetical protein
MDGPTSPITGVTAVDLDAKPRTRVRLVDWQKVLASLDELHEREPGKWGLIGEFDQSVRSNIRRGHYSRIDPAKYEVTTEKIPGGTNRNRALLYMRRRVVSTDE